MVATRERPEEITNNNGTNFVWADRELRELVLAMDQEQIADNAASDRSSIGRMDRPILFIYANRFKGIETGF